MAMIKSYTDLEQSRKLAEILPLESADMHWSKDFDGSWFVDLAEYASIKIPKYVVNVEEHVLPCWSLAALLGDIPRAKLEKIKRCGKLQWICYSFFDLDINGDSVLYWHNSDWCDNPVDACYDVILQLHKPN